MKRQLFIMSFLGCILFLGSLSWTSCKVKKDAIASTPTPPSTPEIQKAPPAFIVAIKEKIKGREKEPAEDVFENIKILKGFPAERVLPIMQMGFSKSLGVKCAHCHEFKKWASEVKPQKQIAREMWAMTGKINQELLTQIDSLQSERPVVNCTTCHRGQIKPATNLVK